MDAKLVEIVIQQVMQALKAQGMAVPAPAPVTAASAKQPKPQIRAKAFQAANPVVIKEHTAGGNPVLQVPQKRITVKPEIQRSAKSFITADMLAQRQRTAGKGLILLAWNEYLTPNAQDLADIKHWSVQKSVQSSSQPQAAAALQEAPQLVVADSPVATNSCDSVGLVVTKATDSTSSLVDAMKRDGIRVADVNSTDCWMRNTERLCQDIASARLAGGIILTQHAADAMLLAAKHDGARPVQGTSVAAVAAAARHYSANILLLEQASSSYFEMRQMAREFVKPRVAPSFADLISRLSALESRT